MRSGKIEFETLAKILLLTAFLIIVLLLFKGCMDAYSDLGTVGMKEYTCWASNVMKSNVAQVWPSACRTQIITEVDNKKLGNLMGKCWWQYGQGNWDLGGKISESLLSVVAYSDIIYTCYSFTPKEDIKLDELKTYMEENNAKGEKVKKVQESMWNYLQTKSEGDNICFDKNDGGILKKGEVYYIKFLDNRGWWGEGTQDLLLISGNKGFFEWYPPKQPGQFFQWVAQQFRSRPCYEYGQSVAQLRQIETDKNKAKQIFNTLTTEIEKCIEKSKTMTQRENCKCGSVNLNEMPAGVSIKIKTETTTTTLTASYNEEELGKQIVDEKIRVTGLTKAVAPQWETTYNYILWQTSEPITVALTPDEIVLSTLTAAASYKPCGN